MSILVSTASRILNKSKSSYSVYNRYAIIDPVPVWKSFCSEKMMLIRVVIIWKVTLLPTEEKKFHVYLCAMQTGALSRRES